MDEDDFRYWSARSLRETQAAINGACRRSRAAHRRLATLCIRRAIAVLDDTAVAPDGATGQG